MIYYALFNAVLALTWCLLQQRITVLELAIGWGYGFLSLYIFRDTVIQEREVRVEHHSQSYFRLYADTVFYVIRFLSALIRSGIQVTAVVLSPRLRIRPGIFAYPLSVKSDAGITLLADSITLTPGTLSVDVSPDRRHLYVHGLNIRSREVEIDAIRDSLERHSEKVLP